MIHTLEQIQTKINALQHTLDLLRQETDPRQREHLEDQLRTLARELALEPRDAK